MSTRLRMYKVLLFKTRRHLHKGFILLTEMSLVVLPVAATLQTVQATTREWGCCHLLAQRKTVTKEHVPQKKSVENEN